MGHLSHQKLGTGQERCANTHRARHHTKLGLDCDLPWNAASFKRQTQPPPSHQPVWGSSNSTWSQRVRVTSQARWQAVHNEILLHVRWSQLPGVLQTVCKPSQKAAQLFGAVSCVHLLNIHKEFKLSRPGLKQCSKAVKIWTVLFYLCLVSNQAVSFTHSLFKYQSWSSFPLLWG